MSARRICGGLIGLFLATAIWAAPFGADKEKSPIGEFTAVKLDPAPVIDGHVADGEWDRAFTTAGMMAPFEQLLQTAETVMSLGYDAENFYFLFRCRRGNVEWRLMKSVRENDDYSYGDPSVEVWVTPPTMVPETYQSVINTYPAVLDNHQIPTRGYTAMGWKGNWRLGVSEAETEYIIEAAIPIKDFGFPTVKDGDVWRFLLCRTVHGTTPRAQSSWSITQGFNEIPQHPPVHLRDDAVVVQLGGVTSLFTGKYDLPLTLLAPKGRAAQVSVEVRRHKGKAPGAADDVVELKQVALKAGERQALRLTGEEAGVELAKDKRFANLTLTVREGGAEGTLIFRQTFPYELNGWTPTAPVRPENAALPAPLAIQPMYAPESRTVIVKADIFDLPERAKVASATLKVTDPATGKVLLTAPLSQFREWYASAVVKLPADFEIPVVDFIAINKVRDAFNAQWDAEQAAKEAANPVTDKAELERRAKIANGSQPPSTPKRPKAPLPPTPSKEVLVEVSIADAAGQVLQVASKPLSLLRYQADWQRHEVGVTDEVIPPWTPIVREGNKLKVWNRAYELDGLGLLRQVDNGGVAQVSSMRLIAQIGGQAVVLNGASPTISRLVPAEADLAGQATTGGLRVTAATRLEFDGLVKNTWTLAPTGEAPVQVERLTLEIVLPEDEASHFCVTAGGWAATHDVTPARWDSRTTANGMLVGDWVPYIWLTNSDRAFLWFADSDKGWIHEPARALPTQEIVRANGTVTLRVHFVEVPASIASARSFTWGYQTFPARPLREGFRAQFCGNSSPVPHATSTFFWMDADWAVLWPYYSSPFAWSFEKSKWFFERLPKDSRHHPLVGSIAHSIGRFRDYESNEFPALLVDWGATPGVLSNADVTASQGPNDFRLWHYRRWVRESGLRGVYVDENYLAVEENFLTGNAWHMPDGKLQRAYNYLGLRDYFKRLKIMFHQEGLREPTSWLHISSGAAYHSWFGDILMEGENVEPTNEEFDYLEVLPAGRLRAIGSPVTAGGMMMMMCQSQRHATKWAEKHVHQFTGWVLAHDITPEQVPLWPYLCEAAKMYEPGVRFMPYWKASTPFKTTVKDCVVSAHRASDRAITWIVNLQRQPATVPVTVDWAALGLDPAKTLAVDAEHGRPVALTATGFSVTVAERDFMAVLLLDRGPLDPAKGQTLLANFEAGPVADQALGVGHFGTITRDGFVPAEGVAGPTGQALKIGQGLTVGTWLHLEDTAGTIAFTGLVPDKAKGQVLSLGRLLEVNLQPDPQVKGAMQLALLTRTDALAKEATTVLMAAPAAGWHHFELSWAAGQATLRVGEQISAPIAIPSFGFGAKVAERSTQSGLNPGLSTPLVIGPRGSALEAVDQLLLARQRQ